MTSYAEHCTLRSKLKDWTEAECKDRVTGQTTDNGNYPSYTARAQIERVGSLTQTASQQTLASYEATCREILTCLETLNELERTGHRIPARDRVKLYYMRDMYLEAVATTFRMGREVIREYLKHSLGQEGE